MTTLTARLQSTRLSAKAAVTQALDRLERAPAKTGRIREWWRLVTPLGRTVMAVAALSWVGGWWLGWRELMVVAGGCLVLLALTALFVINRAAVHVDVLLVPGRVEAGNPSAGQIKAVNRSPRRTLPLQVELPVGAAAAVFDIASLASGEDVEELFVVQTERRGVIRVGPATSLRGDPIGLFHREATSSSVYELIVHPHTVAVEPFGSGLLKDLEGRTTKDLSVSDLAFHALREYAPGDDQRYVHWRSSAKFGKLLVRQFQDTRRSTLCVIVDGDPSAYGDPSEFETAVEVAGSMALRACRDELTSTLVAADQAATGVIPHVLLDALSRAQLDTKSADMATQISRAVAQGADISFGVVVSGSRRTVQEVQRAVARFPAEIRVMAVKIMPGEPSSVKAHGRMTVVHLATLGDLPPVLRAEAAVS